MFVGHYGVSFAVKSADKTIPLWVLFIAVQLVDVFWGIFVLTGVEEVRIVPGITASNPLDLYYMPYTHALLSALLWSLAAGIAYKVLRRPQQGSRAPMLVALAVFSHWILDLIVHRPDLPLYANTVKVGLGLWNYRAAAFVLEAGFLFGGMLLYFNRTTPLSKTGTYGLVVFGVAMLVLQAQVFFGSPPPSPIAAALTALLCYLAFAWISRRLETKRR
jgi:hypothetical protein